MKPLVTLTLILLVGIHVSAQKSNSAKNGLHIELLGAKQSSADFEKYMNSVSDSLGMPGMLNGSPMQYGIGVTVLFEGIEFGGDYMRSFYGAKSNGVSAGRLVLSTFNVRLGPNFSLSKNLLLGMLLMVSSNDIKLDCESTASNISSRFILTDESNPFRSYSLKGRGQVVINIPTKKSSYFTCVKLVPFYDAAITKHNFYKSSDRVLKNYSGSRNSSNNAFGVKLSFGLKLGS